MKIGSCIKIKNNKIGNKTTAEQQQDNTDNKDNNIIFNLLLNKYKQNYPKTYSEKVHRISEIKNSVEYQKLSIADQDRLFNKLMTIRRSDL